MSASDINLQQRAMARTGFLYLLLSLFCALFGAVYEYFSHEVYSYFMLYAFVFPLAGGSLPFLGLALSNRPNPNKISRNLYHSGISALTTGSLFQGVLEIYGTTNRLVLLYWILGIAFLFLGMVSYLLQNKKQPVIGKTEDDCC